MSAAEKAAAPRMIGRYEVIAEIASGGMGIVYLARHAGEAGFQRLFAIKLMHPHLAEDRLFVDMLRDEARIAAHIHHPNVVPILDLGSQDGRYYVVMEFIDGCSFAHLLSRNKAKRPPELVVPIVLDALEGLHAAHTLRDLDGNDLKLVHRDVSPQNILLGVDGCARITDFGIAKAETRITSTRPGMRKGKLSYMAPEQLKEDAENIDHRADIFAAGALLWGALTAQPLFRGASDAATLHNILNKPILPPSKVGLHPPPAFDAICMKALERAPGKRYASALEMADALREALSSITLRSSRGDVADWVKKSFAAELTARNNAIRAVTLRSRPPGVDESLPALPTLTGPTSLSSPGLPAMPPALPGTAAEPAPTPAEASAQPPSLTSVSASRTLHPENDEAIQPDFRPRRRLVIGAGAVAALLVLLLLWIATRSPGETSTPEAAASERPAPAATAPPATTSEPPPETTASTADVAPSAKPEPERRPTRNWGSSTWRPRSKQPAKPTASETAKPEPKPEPKPETKPEPKPAPTPPAATTGAKIEKNPYLRRD